MDIEFKSIGLNIKFTRKWHSSSVDFESPLPRHQLERQLDSVLVIQKKETRLEAKINVTKGAIPYEFISIHIQKLINLHYQGQLSLV